MRNPRQLSDLIDAGIRAGGHAGRPFDDAGIAADILGRLDPEDRRGIEMDILRLIVRARAPYVRRQDAVRPPLPHVCDAVDAELCEATA